MKNVRFAMPLLFLTAFAAADPAPSQPATQPADRSTPVGACQSFDQTVADIGIDGALKFYHCTSNAQRRYARSECEFYVALNRLVRSVKTHQGDTAADTARHALGDSDDYTNVTPSIEGDSASLDRPDGKPMKMIRIAEQWCFSMPEWFEAEPSEDLQTTRLYYESAADQIDAVREQIEAGKLKTPAEIDDVLQRIATTR